MRAACLAVLLSSTAGSALAQAPAAAPKPATPAPAAPATAPAAPAPAPAAPSAAPAAAPAAAPNPQPAPEPSPAQPAPAPTAEQPTTPPPPPPQYQTAPAEPAPAHYPPLGGNKPEPEVEKGDWDPWEHVGESKHNHDGFMLRLTIGVGFGGVGGDDQLLTHREVTLGGAGLNFEVAIGGALTENLVLNADLFQATLFNPTVEVDGEEIGDANDLNEDVGVGEDTELTGIGIGVTYYFMPVNLYLAGSIGIGKIIFVGSSGDRDGSDVGFATNLMIGKEWWVGTDWGIGVAGQMILIAAEDEVLGNVGGIDFGVLFTATYN